MEGSIMVDWRCIGRGRRKCRGEIWSLHSYRGHEPEGKEIWKRLKQSLGCIAHSRALPWLAYCFRSGPSAGGELDKLDGLDQAREALLGRFSGWEALRKFFFYEYRYHTHSAAEPLGTLCRLSEGV